MKWSLTDDWKGKRKHDHMLFTNETFIRIDTESQRKKKSFHTENIEDFPPTTVSKFNFKVIVASGISAKGKSKLVFILNSTKIDENYSIIEKKNTKHLF